MNTTLLWFPQKMYGEIFDWYCVGNLNKINFEIFVVGQAVLQMSQISR